MIKARASGSKVYLYFMKKGRKARHCIPRNSCSYHELSWSTDGILRADAKYYFMPVKVKPNNHDKG